MLPLQVGLVLHLLAIAYGADVKTEDDKKMLLMLEVEPLKSETREKRLTEGEGIRRERQSVDVPPEYFSLLQQLAAQQQQQPQTAATAQQPQQNLIQQLVVTRDGDKQPTATRYIFSPNGNLFQESLSSLGQSQQYETALNQAQFGSGLAQPQQYTRTLGVPVYVQQSPLEQTGPQTLPQAPTAPPRPGTRPRISEFARQQQRVLQEYRDAPLRAQIAGVTQRPRPRPTQPLPTGPNSQSPQVFIPPGQNQNSQPAVPAQFQDPKNPGIVYTPVPVDPAYFQQQYAQLSQQLAQYQPQQYVQVPQQQYVQLPQQYAQLTQQQYATQYAPDSSHIFARTPRPATVQPAPQPVYYQQPEATQTKLSTSPVVQPQYVPQSVPQQYLIETTKPSQPQYVSQEITPQIQYVSQPIQSQPQAAPIRHESTSPSTLLQPVAGRGYFTPSKPSSRSSIYVSRSSVPKSVSLTITDGVSSEKVPVVRLPAATEPRTYTSQDLDALVRAGYVVTPVQDPKQTQYLKPKRQPQLVPEERTNHVIYENPQDGIQYQYSPGTSDSTVTIKTKKSVSSK